MFCFAPVAQWKEQSTSNAKVARSNRARGALILQIFNEWSMTCHVQMMPPIFYIIFKIYDIVNI
jgi:hypothetical protein